MNVLPKIDRRAWLATWAQKRRRQRRGHLLPAPVLRAAWPDLLRWDWDLTDPFKWNVWMSLNGGLSFLLIEDYWAWGNAREFAPDGGSELYFIVGVDAGGAELTERSNVVRPDDAGMPLGTDLLAYWTLDQGAGLDRADASGNGQPLSEFDVWGYGGSTVGSTAGKIGNCVSPDDGSGMCLLNSSMPSFVNGDFSISCWVKMQVGSFEIQPLLCIGADIWLTVVTLDEGLRFVMAVDTEDLGIEYIPVDTGVASIAAGVWAHCVVIKRGENLEIHLNGALMQTATLTGPPVESDSYPFLGTDIIVGCDVYGDFMASMLDEMGLWQRALSVDEVGQLYNGGDGLAFGAF